MVQWVSHFLCLEWIWVFWAILSAEIVMTAFLAPMDSMEVIH
jgi:hypothetical protein